MAETTPTTAPNISPVKFGYTDKDSLPGEFTANYPSYIVINTKKNSIQFRNVDQDGNVDSGEIVGRMLTLSTLYTMTGNDPRWDATKGHVVI